MLSYLPGKRLLTPSLRQKDTIMFLVSNSNSNNINNKISFSLFFWPNLQTEVNLNLKDLYVELSMTDLYVEKIKLGLFGII